MRLQESEDLRRKSNFVFLFTLLIVGLLLCMSSCNKTPVEHINDYLEIEDDHFAEEVAEWGAEQQTGIDIDLSPRSPE